MVFLALSYDHYMHQICTIVATNYIPQALAFLESFRRFDEVTPCTILIVDASSIDIPCDSQTEFISTSSLPIDSLILESMYLYYDHVELATSLKPFLLKHLLENGATTATYIDPDTQIFSSLEHIFQLNLEHSAVLTPHRNSPLPKNTDKFYSEKTFLKYGTYNLGFISVNQSSASLLEWWSERLIFDSTRFINDDVFTDQKWANQFPSYFECLVYKGPEINIAPWNLDERILTIVDEKVYSCGIPVVMIHFSQMSSLLAKGMDSNLWESTLQENTVDNHSLEIISNLTRDYKAKLLDYRSFDFKFSPVAFKSNANLNVYYRKRIRKSLISGQELDSGLSDKLRRRLATIKFFDTSQTLSAFSKYFLPETKKLLNYFLSKAFRRPF
jgi:hypothetical protein